MPTDLLAARTQMAVSLGFHLHRTFSRDKA